MNLRRKSKTKNYNLNGKHIVITGTIPLFTRKEFISYLHRHYQDIIFQSQVNCKTDVLICGFDCGMTKLDKAHIYKTKIINYKEILR